MVVVVLHIVQCQQFLVIPIMLTSANKDTWIPDSSYFVLYLNNSRLCPQKNEKGSLSDFFCPMLFCYNVQNDKVCTVYMDVWMVEMNWIYREGFSFLAFLGSVCVLNKTQYLATFSQCSKTAVLPDELECEALNSLLHETPAQALRGEAVAPAVFGRDWCWLVRCLPAEGGEMQQDVGTSRHWLVAIVAPQVSRVQTGRGCWETGSN